MDFVMQVKTKYPHLTTEDATGIVEKAQMFYFALRYPCELNASEETKSITSFSAQRWVLAACDEIIERLGFNSVIAYKENGVSWSFDNAQLSDKLCNLIKPIVKIV